MKPLPGENVFPHYDEKYICRKGCCGEIHSKRGAERIGMIMPIILLAPLYKVFGLGWSGEINPAWLALLLFELICTILFFIGTRERKSRFILPFIFMWALFFLYSVFAFISLVYVAISPSSHLGNTLRGFYDVEHYEGKETFYRCAFVISAVIVLIFAVIEVWFLDVIRRCYIYFRDFEQHRKRFGTVAVDLGRDIGGNKE